MKFFEKSAKRKSVLALCTCALAAVGFAATQHASIEHNMATHPAGASTLSAPGNLNRLTPLTTKSAVSGLDSTLDLNSCTSGNLRIGGGTRDNQGSGSVEVDRGITFAGQPCSARFTLDPNAKRIELANRSEQLNGAVRYYAFAIRLDPSWPLGSNSPDTVVAQFLNADDRGQFSPPLQLTIQDGEFHMWAYPTRNGKMPTSSNPNSYQLLWSQRATAGNWLQFVIGVRWSNNASTGAFNLTYQGNVVVPNTTMQTLYSNSSGSAASVYAKVGIYGSLSSSTRRMNLGWYRIGGTYQAVTS